MFDPATPPPAAAVAAFGIPHGPVGAVRHTWAALLIIVLTFGVAGWVWTYRVHRELRAHTGRGLGGPRALAFAIVLGVVMPFVTAHEVGLLYRARGVPPPVEWSTGLWVVPGVVTLVGPIVWFVRTNDALNAYWSRMGAGRSHQR